MHDAKLTDTFDVKLLQKIQDTFSSATGMASISTDLEGPVTRPSNFTRFCEELTRQSPIGRERCNQCDLQGGKVSRKTGRPAVYYCHAGLMDFGVPIMVDGKQVGSVLGGQVLTKKPDEEKFREIARELGIDPDRYIMALREIKIVPEAQVRQAAELLYITMEEISALQTQNHRLERSHLAIQKDVDYINEQAQVYAETVAHLNVDQKGLLSRLTALNKVIDNVNNIAKDVVTVSQKIRLISINASIEAARSGLAGRGFSVIAQEIRGLADETSRTVTQIEQYTSEILEATGQVLEISTGSSTALEEQVVRLEDIFLRLNNILAEISLLKKSGSRV